MSKPDQVVVTAAGHSVLAIHATAVHHREFPEVCGEGDSPEDAATRLADLLARTLDSARATGVGSSSSRPSRTSGPSPIAAGREMHGRMKIFARWQ